MKHLRAHWAIIIISLIITACSNSSSSVETSDGRTDIDSAESPAIALTPTNIVQELAAAVCEQLTSCCGESDQNDFFINFIDDERLAELAPRMPPNAPLESDTCPTLLEELYPQIWLGSWLERVEAREVIFNSEAADACMTTLRNASCGEELRAALFDPTCFSNIPPSGGEEQRNLFSRLPRFDEACAPIRDGFGGLYFGSCDPNRSFCCVASDELDGGCTPFPVPGKTGTCKPTASLGESCNDMPLALCKTGLFCDDDTYTCQVDSYEPLSLGQNCMDENFTLLGYCVDSYCSWDDGLCIGLKATGDTCTYAFECNSEFCAPDTGTCIEDPRCEMP